MGEAVSTSQETKVRSRSVEAGVAPPRDPALPAPHGLYDPANEKDSCGDESDAAALIR